MLSVRGLTKTFRAVRRHGGVVALDGVDLDVADGAFATVLGPSGCGKTTLLRAIAGFEEPDSGTIEIAGRQVVGPGRRSAAPHTRGVGYVPQEGALFPHLSVGQNVGFGLSDLPKRDRRTRAADVLDLVGLGGLAHRRPSELSGGQQQRVALARALAPSPRMILLDEPFSALDAHLRRDLRAEVRELLHAIGTTALLVTHDQAEALTMADHLVVMRRGRVVSSGDPRDTYFRPPDLELARFLGDAVVVPGWMGPAGRVGPAGRPGRLAPTVSCALGELPVRAWHGGQGRCEVMIRPENISIQPAAAQEEGTGTVVGQSFFGHDELVHVAVPGLPTPIAVRISGDRRFGTGDAVAVRVERDVCTYPPDATDARDAMVAIPPVS